LKGRVRNRTGAGQAATVAAQALSLGGEVDNALKVNGDLLNAGGNTLKVGGNSD